MNTITLKVFKHLLANGYLAREEEPELFSAIYENDVSDELDVLQNEFDFTLHKSSGRIYFIPNPTNDLFSENNTDLKRSVGSDVKLDDIYLFHYLAVFILYSLYGGSGNNIMRRDFIRIQDLISEFTEHCSHIRSEAENYDNVSDKYSIDFVRIADKWLSKRSETERSGETKYGTVMKIIRKFRDEDLFKEGSGIDTYEPTRKLNDLMPYFLNQRRVAEINSIFEGATNNADDKQSTNS